MPRRVTAAEVREFYRLYAECQTYAEVARRTGRSASTVARYLKLPSAPKSIRQIVREAMEASRYLVLFSGSVSENMLFENGRVLRMNAEDFYSERTVTFFASLQNVSRAPQEAVPNAGETDHLLLKLLYGDDWAVPFAFRWRHLRWMASGSSSGPAADNAAADEAAARIIAEYVERI